MKLEINERVKHRLIGLAVLASIAVIFLPAAFKKSNQELAQDLTMNIQLPAKPQVKELAKKDPNQMFQKSNLAQVNLQQVSEARQLPELSRAEPLEQHQLATENPSVAPKRTTVKLAKNDKQASPVEIPAVKTGLPPVTVAKPVVSPKKTNLPAKSPMKNAGRATGKYSVQLAVFGQYKNAAALKKRIEAKGYPVKILKVSKNGQSLFKVYVGNLAEPQQAKQLQEKLAANYRMKGFVVKGVA